MTRDEVANLLELLQATWPDHPMPDPKAALNAWAIGLGGIAADDALAAVTTWIQTQRFFPSPSQIRALCAAPAVESTRLPEPPAKVFRVWSAEADDYLPLPAPVPYDEAVHGLEARLRRFRGEVLPGDPVPAVDDRAALAARVA